MDFFKSVKIKRKRKEKKLKSLKKRGRGATWPTGVPGVNSPECTIFDSPMRSRIKGGLIPLAPQWMRSKNFVLRRKSRGFIKREQEDKNDQIQFFHC